MNRPPEQEARHRRMAAAWRADAALYESEAALAAFRATQQKLNADLERSRAALYRLRADLVERYGFGSLVERDPGYAAWADLDKQLRRLEATVARLHEQIRPTYTTLTAMLDAQKPVMDAAHAARPDGSAAEREETAAILAEYDP